MTWLEDKATVGCSEKIREKSEELRGAYGELKKITTHDHNESGRRPVTPCNECLFVVGWKKDTSHECTASGRRRVALCNECLLMVGWEKIFKSLTFENLLMSVENY